VKRAPIEGWEMEKLRALVDVGLLNTLQTNDGMAGTLTYDQTIFGDWRHVLVFQQRIRDMKAEDLQAAARKYLVRDNETIGMLETTRK
jgi:predicted Zn-dependent peptidase